MIENDGLFLSLFVSCSLYSFPSLYTTLVYYTFSVGRNIFWKLSELRNKKKITEQEKFVTKFLVSIKGEDFLNNSTILIL